MEPTIRAYPDMRIAIDASFIYTKIGFGTYSYNLIRELMKLDGENKYLLLYNQLPLHLDVYRHIPQERGKRPLSLSPNFKLIETQVKSRLIWSNVQLPYRLRRENVDVFHSLDNVSLPLWTKPSKLIITMHDVIPILFPNYVLKKDWIWVRLAFGRLLKVADVVITVSEASKRDIMRRYNVGEDRIRVVYEGYDADIYRPIDDKKQVDRVRRKYGIDSPYIFCVATLEPRKNIGRLIRAFQVLRQDNRFRDYKLVIAGSKGWIYDKIFERVRQLKLEDRVIFTGLLPEEDLPFLYNGADLFAFPSLYEGFGLPVLEAMACGTPVVTSNGSALLEIVGNAGVLVDPFSAEDIAKGIFRVLNDSGLRGEMVRKGLEQASRFSWERMAKDTLEIYLSHWSLGHPSPPMTNDR